MASACTGLRAANCSRCFDRRARLLNCRVRPQVCTIRPAVASRRVSTAPIAIEQLSCLGRVSVFSHAPLEEFWQRVRRPKLCISLPCCSDFGAIFVQSPCQCCAQCLRLVAPCDPTCVSPAHYTTVRSRPMRFHRPLAACSPVLSRCTRTWITKSSRRRSEFTSGTKPDFLAYCIPQPSVHRRPWAV